MHEPATQLLGIPDRGKHSDANGRNSQRSSCTINFPPRIRDKRNRSGAVTCRLLLSQFLSCWLAEGEGGRREGAGGKGSPVWPVRRYIYILPTGGPGQAGGRCLPSRRTHIQAAKYLPAVLRFRHHQTPCVSGGREAAVNSSGRWLTSRSGLRQLLSSLGFPLP